MTPYFDRDGITIYNARCEDVLPSIDPATVDLLLTDPPYGVSLSNHDTTGKYRRTRSWNVLGDESAEVGQAALSWGATHDLPTIAFASPMKPWAGTWRQHLVWDKGPAVGGGGDVSTCWKQTWELVQVARTGKLLGSRDESVLRWHVTPKDLADHPCQKPVGLMKYLINKVPPRGGVVLDPFMGSGPVAQACHELCRRYIGIELVEDYCKVAVSRLAQQTLNFDEAS